MRLPPGGSSALELFVAVEYSRNQATPSFAPADPACVSMCVYTRTFSGHARSALTQIPSARPDREEIVGLQA